MAQRTLGALALAACLLLASCGNYVTRDYLTGDAHAGEKVAFIFAGNDGVIVTIYDDGTSDVGCKIGHHLVERRGGPHPERLRVGCNVNPPPENPLVLATDLRPTSLQESRAKLI